MTAMNPLVRLGVEVSQLNALLGRRAMVDYLGAIIRSTPDIIRSKSLVPADLSMSGEIACCVRDQKIRIPLDQINALLAGKDPTPTFGAVREMYAGNVYLRAFRPNLKVAVAVDLGANRGLFSLLAIKVLGADQAIGVEPQEFYQPVCSALMNANGVSATQGRRVNRFVASSAESGCITMGLIINEFDLPKIGILKCDIEGAEFDVFLNENAFLDHVENIAMELHPTKGDVNSLEMEIRKKGFVVAVTDQLGRKPTSANEAHYLYASRTGELAPGLATGI
jgi:hypothetical protein